MTIRIVSDCDRHRRALLDYVDRRAIGRDTEAALEHLGRCRACEYELTAVAQTVAALRRLSEEARRADPPADAWLRLRDRLNYRPPRSRRVGSLAGGLLAAALLILLGGPDIVGFQDDHQLVGVTSDAPDQPHRDVEARLRLLRPRGPGGLPASEMGTLPRLYPDNWRPPSRSEQRPPRVE